MDVEVRIIGHQKGKGLFSKKFMQKGCTILEECSFVCCQFSWNEAYGYKSCNHCLRPLETAEENARRLTGQPFLELPYKESCSTDKTKIVTCSSCDVSYCSQECLEKALKEYHATLCVKKSATSNPLQQLNDAWKQIHYPPETNSVMLLTRLVARILQSDDPERAMQQTFQFCHRSVNEDESLAHKLLGEKFKNQLSLLHELFVQAIPESAAAIEQFSSLEGFKTLLALLGTNSQGIGTSPISCWVKRTSELPLSDAERVNLDKFINKLYADMEEVSAPFLNNEGVGLYCLQSSCNHSCVPNAEVAFLHNDSRLSLVALRDIREGEEICISYLDECDLHRSRHSRRKHLMENYLFTCDCPKCEQQIEEADVTSDEEEEEDSDDSMSS